ncbi:DUF3368 domain-containing protein [Synechococcus sp. Nb3U1]|uniref:DUF3368 domain-containing protein n=1 Tax=Synechococcus sp. Nb3U1 TaxID=1914529 RepID=UPI003FCCD9AC
MAGIGHLCPLDGWGPTADGGHSRREPARTRSPAASVALVRHHSVRGYCKSLRPAGVNGTLGLLIWAKQQGTVSNLKEQLDALQTEGKFRLGKQVYKEAFRRVWELSTLERAVLHWLLIRAALDPILESA